MGQFDQIVKVPISKQEQSSKFFFPKLQLDQPTMHPFLVFLQSLQQLFLNIPLIMVVISFEGEVTSIKEVAIVMVDLLEGLEVLVVVVQLLSLEGVVEEVGVVVVEEQLCSPLQQYLEHFIVVVIDLVVRLTIIKVAIIIIVIIVMVKLGFEFSIMVNSTTQINFFQPHPFLRRDQGTQFC